ncbi:monooxygenase [Apiospora saccharicola]
MTTASKSPHVLILGAGLGGLTLAQSLRKKDISFEVFEKAQDDKQPQGWAVGLHTMLKDFHESMPDDMPDFGMVNHLNPLKIMPEIAFYNGPDGEKLGYRDNGAGYWVRANRTRLRDWLSTKINVQFNKQAVRIEEDDSGVTVHFKDGSKASGDIVVGAEGVHSPTRKHLLKGEDKLVRHKTASVGGECTLSGPLFVEQLQLAHSSYMINFPNTQHGDGKKYHLFVGLNKVIPDGKSGDFYFTLLWTDEGVATDPDHFWTRTASREELHAFARRITADLPEKFRRTVDETTVEGMLDKQITIYTLILDEDALPAGRITLLGDAAHAMTPFRGEGGCHAMQDALKLARAVASIADKDDAESIKTVLGAYQKEMIKRGSEAARLSDTQLDQERPPNMFMQPLPKDQVVI